MSPPDPNPCAQWRYQPATALAPREDAISGEVPAAVRVARPRRSANAERTTLSSFHRDCGWFAVVTRRVSQSEWNVDACVRIVACAYPMVAIGHHCGNP